MILYGCSMLFRRHRNVMEFVCLYTAVTSRSCRFWMKVRNRDWWQRVVFSPEMRSFLPLHRFLSAYYNRCTSRHSCTSRAYAHFSRSGNTAIKVFTACIFRLKSVCHYVNTIMFAAIMSFITLFKSKYCTYMR